MKLPIDSIRLDGGTQPRTGINAATVSEYAELVMAGLPFKDDPVVFFDGVDYWLADGFHRVHGTRQAGRFDIVVDMRQGTQRDAIKHSLSANETHGLRRSRDDKRKAVRTALEDDEWGQWSDREIARLCAVSHTFVSSMREELNPLPPPPPAPREPGNVATKGRDEEPADPPAPAGNVATGKPTPAPAPSPAQPPAKAAAPAAGTEAETDDGDHVTADELMREMQAEIESLTRLNNSLKAEDKGEEVTKLHRLLQHAQRQQNEAMAKASTASEREAWASRQLKRCGKAVGETDPEKIAAKVEAFVRTHKKVAA